MRRTEIIDRIRNKIKELPVQATVILFGNEARGEARPDSDIDLLILIDKDELTGPAGFVIRLH
ncbi:MAG: nucleotidyltransferase domain-containing protein [Tannerellaceae bacterium]|nr:nucleotidyltransferase domain-containing protein [Tannerellaceae bacterium]